MAILKQSGVYTLLNIFPVHIYKCFLRIGYYFIIFNLFIDNVLNQVFRTLSSIINIFKIISVDISKDKAYFEDLNNEK